MTFNNVLFQGNCPETPTNGQTVQHGSMVTMEQY